MRKVKRTLVKVKKITVNCERNDPVDMKCGGPAVLGFDFYVDADEDMVDFIKSKLRENGLPVMSISVSKKEDEIVEKNLWTKEKISECIRKGY